MNEDQIHEIAGRLREEHFARAHTDMVGDEEYRAGYLAGIAALEIALTDGKPKD